MASHRSVLIALTTFAALLLATCSGDKESSDPGRAPAALPPPAPEPQRPVDALRASPDDLARRIGHFTWIARVEWSVTKLGVNPVKIVERHDLRQSSSGDFAVSSVIDPGTGPGSVTGMDVIVSRGTTYARSRWAPFRARPDDRGQEARHQRDLAFHLGAELARLYGAALSIQEAGEVTFLGRRTMRHLLSLSGELPKPSQSPRGLPNGKYDPDTERRVRFLEGRIPVALRGELWLDTETRLPLAVSLKGAFSDKSDPHVRVDVELNARTESIGAAVPAIAAPQEALPDERKPRGVANALEAAGLRKRPTPGEPGRAEGEKRRRE